MYTDVRGVLFSLPTLAGIAMVPGVHHLDGLAVAWDLQLATCRILTTTSEHTNMVWRQQPSQL